MSRSPQTTTVRHEVVVDAPVERAFSVFVTDIGSFKPHEHNLLGVAIAETIFEPRVGGHVYDRGVDGRECRWARVLAYESPTRLVISWDINQRWQLETDPAKTSEIEVTFTADGPARTQVLLTHRHLDRHGEGWESMRDAVGSGWSLTRYAEVAAQG